MYFSNKSDQMNFGLVIFVIAIAYLLYSMFIDENNDTTVSEYFETFNETDKQCKEINKLNNIVDKTIDVLSKENVVNARNQINVGINSRDMQNIKLVMTHDTKAWCAQTPEDINVDKYLYTGTELMEENTEYYDKDDHYTEL